MPFKFMKPYSVWSRFYLRKLHAFNGRCFIIFLKSLILIMLGLHTTSYRCAKLATQIFCSMYTVKALFTLLPYKVKNIVNNYFWGNICCLNIDSTFYANFKSVQRSSSIKIPWLLCFSTTVSCWTAKFQ